jgi:hypothetical protein
MPQGKVGVLHVFEEETLTLHVSFDDYLHGPRDIYWTLTYVGKNNQTTTETVQGKVNGGEKSSKTSVKLPQVPDDHEQLKMTYSADLIGGGGPPDIYLGQQEITVWPRVLLLRPTPTSPARTTGSSTT